MSDVTYSEEDRDKTYNRAIFSSTATSVSSDIQTVPARGQRTRRRKQDIESAIYSHVRALRALGRTRVNTAEIAKALDLPIHVVDEIVAKLTRKGVKIVG